MKEPWDITTPIKLLFAQIGDGQAYARAGGKPYTEPQLVRISYHNIEATKRMEIACREWRAKPAANKTWTNLKLDMKAAHLDLNLTMTMDTGGYGAHQAEKIDKANQTYFANMLDQQTMTTATIATIMETMQQLSNQVKDGAAKQLPASNQDAKTISSNETANPSHQTCPAQQNQALLLDTWVPGCRKDRTGLGSSW